MVPEISPFLRWHHGVVGVRSGGHVLNEIFAHGLRCRTVSSPSWRRTSSGDERIDPVVELDHVGVHARLVRLTAAVSPAHQANNGMGPVTLTHQRATRVALKVRVGGWGWVVVGCEVSAFLAILRQKEIVSHKPDRNRCLHWYCPHRTCCHPASLRKHGGLYIWPGRWGGRERPSAGSYHNALEQNTNSFTRSSFVIYNSCVFDVYSLILHLQLAVGLKSLFFSFFFLA